MKFHAALNPVHTSSAATRNPQNRGASRNTAPTAPMRPWSSERGRPVSMKGRRPAQHQQHGHGVDRHHPAHAERLQHRAEAQTARRIGEALPPADPPVLRHPRIAQVRQRQRVDVRALPHQEDRVHGGGDHDPREGPLDVECERGRRGTDQAHLQHGQSPEARVGVVPPQRVRDHPGRRRERDHDPDLAGIEPVVLLEVQRQEREERRDREPEEQEHPLDLRGGLDPGRAHPVTLTADPGRR